MTTAQPRTSRAAPAPGTDDHGIVLIVEDDPDLGDFLLTALSRRSGRTVRLAANGFDALAILATEPVDVLLTDIQMPGMNGLDLVQEVRKTNPALPIVMMTAHASVDQAISALRHQVDEFLVKPVTAVTLVPTVRELAERGAAARRTARALADVDVEHTPSADVTDIERQVLMDLAAVMGEQSSLSQQLERASQVQRDLLPRRAPTLAGYEFAGSCIPSFAIGGDFFDWYPDDCGVGFTVADVMGKGIPAALVTATVRAVMRSVSKTGGPASALTAAAAALRGDLEETGTFVTVFHARLHGPTGTVTFADAGHGLGLVVRPDGSFSRIVSSDLPLGVSGDSTWNQGSASLEPGDSLVSFSDGLFDLLGGGSEAFAQISAMVVEAATCARLVEQVTLLATAEAALIDDVTVVAIRRDAIEPVPQ